MKKSLSALYLLIGLFMVAIVQGCGSSMNENVKPATLESGSIEKFNLEVDKVMADRSISEGDISRYNSIKNKAIEALSKDDYDMKKEAEISVIPLINCVNNEGEMDHKIFSYTNNGINYLLVLCHGYSDGDKEYGIFMHGQYRTDYIKATEESLAYWSRLGKLRNTKFDAVILSTCYSGYAPQEASMPIFDINLYMANNNKDVNYYWVETKDTGETILHLWRGIRKKSRTSAAQRDISADNIVSPMIDGTKNFGNSYKMSTEEMKNISML